MTATTFPVSIEIGAVLGASLGSALRSTEAQLGRLGDAFARLDTKRVGIDRLEALKAEAQQLGAAWRTAQTEVERFKSGREQFSTKGLDAAKARVAKLEGELANPDISTKRRLKIEQMLADARKRLAAQQAAADARFDRQLERLIAQAGRAKDAFERVKTAIAQEVSQLERSGIKTAQLAAEKVKLGQAIDLLKSRTEALSRAQAAHQAVLDKRDAYRQQITDAIALGGALYGLVQPAVQFESVMADVKKAINFDTPEQFEQMSKDVLLLSTRIPMAADGIGAIVAAAGQAGIAREELLRFAEDAAKMGVAFDLSGQQAGAAMTGLRSIFGLTQDEVVKLGDAINHLSNNMDAKAADLLNIANRAGSTAKLFGLSGEQLNALGATFLALKTPPEVAATGINALLMKLATADKQNERFQQGLQDIGLSAEVMTQMIQRDAQGALTTFLRQVKNAPDLMGTLSDLFGAEYADDIAKLVGSMETYEQAVGLVADQTAYAGSMQAEYEARSATTANNLQLLKNQMSRLGITVGNALLPALNSLVGALMGPIDSLANLAERFPIVTQGVVGTVGAVLGLKVATIALGYAWTFVKGPILGAQVAFQSARAGLALLQVQATATGTSAGILSLAWSRIQTGALGLIAPIKSAALAFWGMLPAIGATTAALLANPITWIVAGIGAAVAGLALVIRKYWEPIVAWIGGFWEGVKEGVAPAIEGITQVLAPLEPIGSAIAAAFSVVGDAISGVVGWMSDLLAPVALAQEEFDRLAANGQSVGVVIGQTLGAAFHALTLPLQAVATLVDIVGQGLAKVGETIDWVSSKVGAVAKIGTSIASFFGIRTAPASAAAAAPSPAVLNAQPVARTNSVSTSITAPITIHAPAGADAREIARLVDERLRAALRDQNRRAAALYD